MNFTVIKTYYKRQMTEELNKKINTIVECITSKHNKENELYIKRTWYYPVLGSVDLYWNKDSIDSKLIDDYVGQIEKILKEY